MLQHSATDLPPRDVFGRCQWQIGSDLLTQYVREQSGKIRGHIWFDEDKGSLYQGLAPIEDLTPQEFNILRFLVQHPHVRCTNTMIISNAWPEDENREWISANTLQVHISSIRKKIETDPSTPRYLTTWNGRPGGYQFFPEGKPA